MIKVKCKRGAANKQADAISNSLIINSDMAIAVGKRFLDDPAKGGYYLTKNYSMTAPCRTMELKLNGWIKATIPKLSLTEKPMKIVSFSITGNNTGAVTSLEVQSYE